MDWDNAKNWAEEANSDKQIREIEPRWSWDCGLKLDFDGGLLRVSSRFYQYNEDIFSGTVAFMIGDDDVFERDFTPRHIDILKKDVEDYVNQTANNLRTLCSENIGVFVVAPQGKEI